MMFDGQWTTAMASDKPSSTTQAPTSAAAALAAQGQRRWPDTLRNALLALAAIFLGCACRAGREAYPALMTLDWPPDYMHPEAPLDDLVARWPLCESSLQPDIHGCIVDVMGNRALVRLDADSERAPRNRRCSMAIISANCYVGELFIVGSCDDHVLGKVYYLAQGAVCAGDRVSCRTP
jgi:hypothetical protein